MINCVTISSEKLKKQCCKTLSLIYCPREKVHSFLNLNTIICLKQYGNKQAFDLSVVLISLSFLHNIKTRARFELGSRFMCERRTQRQRVAHASNERNRVTREGIARGGNERPDLLGVKIFQSSLLAVNSVKT